MSTLIRAAGDARGGARAARRARARGRSPGAPTSSGRSIAASSRPSCSSTSRGAASSALEPRTAGFAIGAGVTLADARRGRARRALRRARDGRLARRLAAAAQRRHRRRQPLPGHALLVLPRRGVALLARRRRHLLRADRRPPQAQPQAGRLHLGASRPTSRPRSPPAARASSCARRGEPRARRCSTSTGIPTEDNRSLLTLESGEIVSEVRLPAPPDGLGLPRASASARRSRSRSSPSRPPAAATETSASSPAASPTYPYGSTPTIRSQNSPATHRRCGNGPCSRR